MLDGVLFFPVTPFAADGTVDAGVLAEHLRRGLAAGPGGVFAARAVRPLMIASTATLWAVSPVSTMMSASP